MSGYLGIAFVASLFILTAYNGYKSSQTYRYRELYRPIRADLIDLRGVLLAAKDTNSRDYQLKLDYVIEELRKLI